MTVYDIKIASMKNRLNDLFTTLGKVGKMKFWGLFLLFSVLVCPQVMGTNYYAIANGNWNTNTTWSTTSGGTAVGSGVYPVAGDIVYINAAYTVTVPASTSMACASVTISTTSGAAIFVNSGATLTISSGFLISSISGGNMSATVSGSGTLTCSYLAIGTSITSTSSYATYNTSLTSTISSLIISGNLSLLSSYIKSGGSTYYNNPGITITSGTTTVNGSIVTTNANSSNSSSIILGASSPTLILGGSIPFNLSSTGTNTATFTGTGATVNYAYAGAQTVMSTTYTNLVVSNSGIKTLAGAVTVNNKLYISGSAILATGTYQVTGNSAGTFTMDSGTGLSIGSTSSTTAGTASTIAFPLNYTTANISLNAGSTVTYQQNAVQTVSATPAYGNLVLSTGGTKTASGALIVKGDLTVASGPTFTAVGAIGVSGSATITGTLDLGTTAANSTITGAVAIAGTLTYNTTGLKTLSIGGNLSGAGTITMATLAHVLNLAGTSNAIGTLTTTSGVSSIVNYTSSNVQSVFASTNYRNLTLSGGGAKTLSGASTVNNTLTFTNGRIDIGNYNLTLASGGTLAGYGASTGWIITSGAGYFCRAATALATLYGSTNGYYPVGSENYYTPMYLSALSATSVSGYLGCRAVTGVLGNTCLKKYWDVTTSGITSLSSANAIFTYNDNEIQSLESSYNVYYKALGVDWVTPSTSSVSAASNTITTGAVSSLAGYWTAGTSTPSMEWYSYQNGDWDSWTSWTQDPSGYTRINPTKSVPSSLDRVSIINTKTITISASNKTITYLTISGNSTLDIGTTTGHSFSTIDGTGYFKLASANLDVPASSGTFFQSGGGTVIYSATTTTAVFSDFTFNNLILNMGATSSVVTCTGNLAINGDFTITQGIFKINNNSLTTALKDSVMGDVLVESNGSIQVGTGSVSSAHRFIIKGNFTNNGTAYFTGLTAIATSAPSYRVDVVFNNATLDQNVLINGITNFYRIEINKGTDQTYILNIDATATGLFNLYGLNSTNTDYNPIGTPPNITNLDALGLLAGTVRLGANIVVSSLGSTYSFIDEDACIWLDGATASITGQALYLYGKLKITNSSSNLSISTQGIVMRFNAAIEIEDGSLTSTEIRTSMISGTHRGSYIQKGGTVTLTGNITQADHATLSMTFPAMSFKMSGGNLIIKQSTNVTGGVAANYSLILGMDASNCSITGGTVKIIQNTRTANFTSTIPFWNFIIEDGSSTSYTSTITSVAAGSGAEAVSAQPLVVLNDFSLIKTASFNTNGKDVYVGRNFSIGSGSTFTPGVNTIYFNGAQAQVLADSGTITNDSIHHLYITNKSDLTLAGTVSYYKVNGTLTIDTSCVFRDNGKILYAYGNITNSGTHYHQTSGAGSIQLLGTAAQVISGSGEGSFNNLTLNKTGGTATLSSNIAITGILRLAGTGTSSVPTRFNIGGYNLFLDSTANVYYGTTGVSKSFTPYCMILTNGLASDGGITKRYNSTTGFTFPFGVYTNSTYYYMPANIRLSLAPTKYGTITSRPVSSRHPLTKTTNSLSCYWKTVGSGFSGFSTGNVIHKYYYDSLKANYFVTGTEGNYIPAVYRGGANWTLCNYANYVNASTNEVLYDRDTIVGGDYTAGELPAFSGTLKVLFSVTNGNWASSSTWSATRGGTGGIGIPSDSTIVYICASNTVTTAATGASCGKLFIESGGTLNLGTFAGHNFRAATGQGTLRIASTGYFPQGDWGDFLNSGGGTVEYYNSGASVVLPTSSNTTALALDHYNNLKLTQVGNYSITLPAGNLRIYRDLILKGSGSYSYRTQTDTLAARTIIVDSTLRDSSGIFLIRNKFAQTIKIKGNMYIASAATFRVATTTAVAHALQLYGSLTNNGTLLLTQGTSGASGKVTTTFMGATDTYIAGTGTNTLYSLIVDKGTDTTSVLTVNNTLTTVFDPALTLNNGTFKWNNSGSFNVSTYSMTIPQTACLSVNNGILTIASTTSYDSCLYLNGKLEVQGGVMNIGSASSRTKHSDIEYAPAGKPTVSITGGTLNVNGRIRRSTVTTQGALVYNQSGSSTVNIYGANSNTTELSRAMLEVCNDSSSFTMTGGTINIYRGSGTTYGDLYLRPSKYSVTGGEVILNPLASSTYLLDATCNLNNLTVTGSASYSAIAKLTTNPLVLSGNLTISNSYSTFSSGTRNANVSIAGNFINYGTYTPGSNTTIFNGTGAQTATFGASTSFYDLAVDKTSGILTLAGTYQPSVSNDLLLNSGTLNDGTRTLTVYGNISNNATHTSTSGTITLAGTSAQTISGDGNGAFGNVVLNNLKGVNMTNDFTINGLLTFTDGFLNINDNLLTFGSSASSPVGAATDQCIITDGALIDAGVKKVFSGTSGSFTFPIGVAGKYTPVSYSLTYTTPGNLTIKPVNRTVPSLTNLTLDELQYYWSVKSASFQGLSATQRYFYLQSDILGSYLESNSVFVGGRFSGNVWYNLGHSVINSSAHSIDLSGATELGGDYTCGWSDNFGSKLVYYSRNAASNIKTTGADWSNLNSWTTDPSHEGNAVTDTIYGNPVVIKKDHIINMSKNNQNSYSVTDSGTLNMKAYTGHSLGYIKGNGRIILQNTTNGDYVFPGGDYSDFMDNSGSTIEYYGVSSTTEITSSIKTYQNIEFTGAASKYLSDVPLIVKGNLKINGSQVINKYNTNITIYGNWVDNVSSGYVPAQALVTFTGTKADTLQAPYGESFYNLKMNKSSNSLLLLGPVTVTNVLTLTAGNILSGSTSTLCLSSVSTSAISGGSSLSFVDGPLKKNITNGSSFVYPIGNGTRYGRLELPSTTTSSSPAYWTAQYFNVSPQTISASSTLASPLTSISNNEYWKVTRGTSNTANIRLRWDGDSYPAITSNSTALQYLRVVEYNGSSAWSSVGQTINTSNQTVATSSEVTTDNYNFTLGISGITASLTSSSVASVCNDGTAVSIPVALTGVKNWTVYYRVKNTSTSAYLDFGPTVLSSTSGQISFSGADLTSIASSNTSTTYLVSLISVTDGSGNTGVCSGSTTVTILLTHTPVISSLAFTVGAGETRNFYTTNYTGDTYAWVWSGTSGGTIATPAAYSTNIVMSSATGTYVLRLTETTAGTGCSVFVEKSVEIVSNPSPVISPVASVCAGDVVTYSTPLVSGHTYSWTVVGGTPTTSATNTITVTWGTGASGTITVTEKNGSLTGTKTEDYLIGKKITTSYTLSAVSSTLCFGNSTSIGLNGSQSSVTYQLRNNSDNSLIGNTVPGTGAALSFATGSLYTTTTFNVLGYNIGCSASMASTSTVTVLALPTITLGTMPSVCKGVTSANLSYSTITGSANQYNITYDATAKGQGFSDISYTSLPSVIPITIPSGAASGTYNAVLIVRNSSTTCTSDSYSITVTVYSLPSVSASATAAKCYSSSTGAVALTITGGTSPYTYAWSNGTTTQNLSNVTAGSYSVTVTDANSCSASVSSSVTQPSSALSVAGVVVNAGCYGASTGSVTLTVSGGTSPYSYLWSNGAISKDVSGLASGSYSVTVTDANGCTLNQSFSVSQPSAALAGSIVVTNVKCLGGATGSANLTVTGGTSAYTYAWSSGAITEDLSSVGAGVYTVTVTDAKSCSVVVSATITQPTSALSSSISTTSVGCYGALTGAADLMASGGTTPYTFLWSNGATTEDLSSVAAGTYSVTVTDANSCTSSSSGTVAQPSATLVGIASIVAVGCYGESSGGINVTVSGGTSPYSFLWSDASTSEDLSNVSVGTYSVTITDANGCTATSSGTVTQPSAALSGSTTVTAVGCYGTSTGAVNLTVSGGTSPYTFLWSNGATTEDLSNVSAGTYSVIITDANGCTAASSGTVTQPSAALSAAITSKTNVLVFGASTGSATAVGSNGTAPYSYSWNTSPVKTTAVASSLAAGTYTCTVTDANSCSTSTSVTITQPAMTLSGSATVVNVKCYGGSNGSVDLSVSGGTSPYTYLWSNGATTEDLSGVSAGIYTVTITDANSVSVTASATVGQPTAALTASISAQTNVLCYGNSTGSATAAGANGTSPYTYSWNTSPVQSTATASSLAVGTYTCTVTDANACTTTKAATITQPASAVTVTSSSNSPVCTGNAINLQSSASGGTSGYSYSWAGPNSYSSSTQNPSITSALLVMGGSYTVTATDANGCHALSTISVVVNKTPVSGPIYREPNK